MDKRWVSRHAFLLATLLVVCIAGWQVISTYTLLSQTVDEPNHVATGMQWLQEGTVQLHAENPPLARVAVALGPHLAGHRLGPRGSAWQRGTDVLYTGGSYRRNLVRARLGTLPFFLLAVVLVWLWSYRLGGGRAASVASAAFCTLPPVLGHAGLATTDLPFVATFLLALYTYVRWLEAPTILRSIYLGIGLGLALVTKFSTLAFFPICAIAVLLVRLLLRERGGPASEEDQGQRDGSPGGEDRVERNDRPAEGALWWRWVRGAAIVIPVGLLVLWSSYRFSVGTFAGAPDTARLIELCFPDTDSAGRRLVEGISRTALPAPDFLYGMLWFCAHAARGHAAYLLGHTSQTGFWSFYPMALSVKTPLAFSLLSITGLVTLLRKARECRWQPLAPAVAAAAILPVAMSSSINIGLRHVLIVYPLLAITAGLGIEALFRRTTGRLRYAVAGWVVMLLLWQLVLVFRVHPNYLAYFNLLAGREPGRVLVDSDLDWGQDLLQLESFFEGRDVELLHVAYFGTARLCDHELPRLRWLGPAGRVTGWIAISEMYFRDHWDRMYRDPCDKAPSYRFLGQGAFAWLHAYEPVAVAGKSIRIYYIPEE